jgi:2-polyprenyl-3-methyl-5-hydroxy-6-metoxy-1,4-benzoquinol methylase
VGCACGDFGKLLKLKKCNVYGMEYDARSIDIASSTSAYQIVHQVDLNKFNANNYQQYLSFFDSITFLIQLLFWMCLSIL